MQPRYVRDAGEWLVRADRDLLLAARALDDEPILGEGAAYLSQQATEKALKGFLTAYGRPFLKTHDLTQLFPDCIEIEPDFAKYQESAPRLSGYASRFRYPGGPLQPPEQEARAAMNTAREIVAFVQACLSGAEEPPPPPE